MRGVFSTLPADNLAAALAPIADHVERLEWAVNLYNGPLRFPYAEEDEPENVLSWHHDQQGLPMGWFGRGFLPRHADCLIFDEWGYYLGFDAAALAPEALVRELQFGGIRPGRRLFRAVAKHGLLFLLRVDRGWWEAYTPDTDILEGLMRGWNGRWVDSDRWTAGPPRHADPDAI
jgi:hypothetical protein